MLLISSLFVGCVYSPRTDKSVHTNTNHYYGDVNKNKSRDDDYLQYKQNDSPALSDDAPFYNNGFGKSKKNNYSLISERERQVHGPHYIPFPVVTYVAPPPNRSIYYVESRF